MKKAGIILVMITSLSCMFIAGYFIGANLGHSEVTVSKVYTTPETTERTQQQLLDINTATVEELADLPGIGEVLAQRIVDHRAKNGPFTAVAELTEVEDIGDKRLSAILGYITVGGPYEDTGR